MKELYELDLLSGHGDNTPGKRSIYHYLPNGLVRYKENHGNERVVNMALVYADIFGVQANHLNPEWYDVSLEERCRRNRRPGAENRIVVAVHADAIERERCKCDPEDIHGMTIYYFSKKGKRLAEHFTAQFRRTSTFQIHIRSPRKARFKVLRSTESVAILIEMAYMTNSKDLDLLQNVKFQKWVAKNIILATKALRPL